MYGTVLSHVWDRAAQRMGQCCAMYGTVLRNVWDRAAPCMRPYCAMYGSVLRHVWDRAAPWMGPCCGMYGAVLRHICDRTALCMGPCYAMYGTLLAYPVFYALKANKGELPLKKCSQSRPKVPCKWTRMAAANWIQNIFSKSFNQKVLK